MEPYSYKPLVPERNEIRVLEFVDSSKSTHPETIHCSLETVSLDDCLPGSVQFLEARGLECGLSATRLWVHAAQTQTHTSLTTLAPQLPFARWRLDSDRSLDLDLFGDASRKLGWR